MRTVLILMALCFAPTALAQQTFPIGSQDQGGCLSADKSTSWTSNRGNCEAARGTFSPLQVLSSGIIGATSTITAIIPKACGADQEIVMRANGHYGCARDVTE